MSMYIDLDIDVTAILVYHMVVGFTALHHWMHNSKEKPREDIAS